MRRLSGWVVVLAVLGSGCGEAMVGGDDAGAADAGPIADDAGPPQDAGPAGDDAGQPVDGGGAIDDAGLDTGMDAGGDAGVDTDAGADGGMPACPATDLVLAAVDPGTFSGPGAGSIAIYNPSASAVDVDATDYLLHEDPDSVLLRDLSAGVTIPPGALRRFPYPAEFSDGDASGELALYRDTAVDAPASLIDFVCWGFGHSSMFSVQPVAEADGDWTGTCAPSISGPELRRIRGTDGRSRASYDTTGLTALFACP